MSLRDHRDHLLVPAVGADCRAERLALVDDGANLLTAPLAGPHATDTVEIMAGENGRATHLVATMPTDRARLNHSDTPSQRVQRMTPFVYRWFRDEGAA